MRNKIIKKIIGGGTAMVLVFVMTGLYLAFPGKAIAAPLTSKSDTLSRLQDNTASNHTIEFTTSSGVAVGETIVVTFPAAFDTSTIVFGDVDVKDDSTELTLGANCDATEDASAVMAADVLTITLCSEYTGGIGTNSVVEIQIGTNADSGSHQIVNPDISSDTAYEIGIDATTDDGQVEIQIVMDDTVHVTATVDESITFSISDVDVGFADLYSNKARYATADPATGSDTEVSAHNLQIATNASGGWAITYDNDQSLKFGSNEIDEATITNDANGEPGTEQFAMSFTTNGNSTITTAYSNTAHNYKYEDNPAAPVMIATEAEATATETISAYYLANIAQLTPSGDYSTDITYIATATY